MKDITSLKNGDGNNDFYFKIKNMAYHYPSLTKVLMAGFIAITANTIVLKAAPLFNITAESGGLLKLILLKCQDLLSTGTLLYFKTTFFWLVFHYLTGFTMVLIYLYIFQSILPGKGWLKGSIFSLFPWLINGFIVLPLLAQGIFGISKLTIPGIIYFFIANLIFGIVLGILSEKLLKNHQKYSFV